MTVKTIGIKELNAYVRKPGIRLVDLRTREEYAQYHLEGAMNIPYAELKYYKSKLSKSTSYILYCERGANSLLAARELSRDGYQVYTVAGGIHAWEENRLN